MDTAFLEQVVRVNQAYHGLGHTTLERGGATFICSPAHADFDACNHVDATRLSDEADIGWLLVELDRVYEYRRPGANLTVHTSFQTSPELEARLAHEGFLVRDVVLMVLDGELRGATGRHDVRPMVTADDWRDFGRLAALDWYEYTGMEDHTESDALGARLAAMEQEKCPPVAWFLAHADGKARGYFDAWEGLDGIGHIENLFVEPDYRHRGLATALIARCVAHCRQRGAGPVIIPVDSGNTSRDLYAALGFRPAVIKRLWRRQKA